MTTQDSISAVRSAPALVGTPATASGTALDLIAQQARLRPNEPAVVHDGTTVSYRDLWLRACGIAGLLADQGVGPGHVVGLAARRSADLVAAVLGILRCGAACLPIDQEYPQQRLRFMLSDSGASVVVGHTDVLKRIVPAELTTVSIDGLADLAERPLGADRELPMPCQSDACYIIYTSGSTGTPKGVVQEHRSVINLVCWQRQQSTCGAGTRTAQFSPISFDVSFQEIFCTLATGGTLVCINEADRRDPTRLWQVLARESVHRLFLPFVALETLSMFADQLAPERIVLREVITAGEQLKCTAPLRAFFQRVSSCRLVNQYGPTETQVVTSHVLGLDVSQWPLLPPIGPPIWGVRVHVLDADLRPVPTGEVGELWVGGALLARGYWQRPDLTAQRFVPEFDPEGTQPIGRAYHTGDLVRVTPAGELEFVGRADDQIKIRGIRVEPGEIEAVLMEHPDVLAAAVVSRGRSSSDRVLVAYVVGISDRQRLATLRAHVRERLPETLVPARFQPIDKLPLTPSGKVDRHKLQEGDASTHAQPRGIDTIANGDLVPHRAGT